MFQLQGPAKIIFGDIRRGSVIITVRSPAEAFSIVQSDLCSAAPRCTHLMGMRLQSVRQLGWHAEMIGSGSTFARLSACTKDLKLHLGLPKPAMAASQAMQADKAEIPSMTSLSRQSSSPRVMDKRGLLYESTEMQEQFNLRVLLPGTDAKTPSMTFPPFEMPGTLAGLVAMVADFCEKRIDVGGVPSTAFNPTTIVLKLRSGHLFTENLYRQAKSDDCSRERVEVRLRDAALDDQLAFPKLFQRIPNTHIKESLANPAYKNIVRVPLSGSVCTAVHASPPRV